MALLDALVFSADVVRIIAEYLIWSLPVSRIEPTLLCSFETPASATCMRVSPADGNLWITSAKGVYVLSQEGQLLSCVAEAQSGAYAGLVFVGQHAIATGPRNQISIFNLDGSFVRRFELDTRGSSSLKAITADAQGRLFTVDATTSRVFEFDKDGGVLHSFSSSLRSPEGIAFSAAGQIWVADTGIASKLSALLVQSFWRMLLVRIES